MLTRLIGLGLVVLLGACAAKPPPPPEPPRLMGMATADVNVRINPTLDSSVLTVAFRNSLFLLVESRGDWYKADLGGAGGVGNGWVKAEFVAVEPPPQPKGPPIPIPAMLVDRATLWSSATAEPKEPRKLGELEKGTAITIAERLNTWYRLIAPQPGWIEYRAALIDVPAALAAKPLPPEGKDAPKK
jgi:hypothetical protein